MRLSICPRCGRVAYHDGYCGHCGLNRTGPRTMARSQELRLLYRALLALHKRRSVDD